MRMVWRGKLLVLSALTRALNQNGYKVHVSHVSRVLRGEREASKEFLKNTAQVLGVTIAEARQFVEDCAAAIHHVESMPHLIEED